MLRYSFDDDPSESSRKSEKVLIDFFREPVLTPLIFGVSDETLLLWTHKKKYRASNDLVWMQSMSVG